MPIWRAASPAVGFNLMLNFSNPYLATGLGDFWQRWHISLSRGSGTMSTYLGGNRGGPWDLRQCSSPWSSPASGTAAWTFICWGACTPSAGCVLATGTDHFYSHHVEAGQKVLVFAFVSLTWVFFRAGNLPEAHHHPEPHGHDALDRRAVPLTGYVLASGLWAYEYAAESRFAGLLALAPVKVATALAMILYLLFFTTSRSQAFIYFQF